MCLVVGGCGGDEGGEGSREWQPAREVDQQVLSAAIEASHFKIYDGQRQPVVEALAAIGVLKGEGLDDFQTHLVHDLALRQQRDGRVMPEGPYVRPSDLKEVSLPPEQNAVLEALDDLLMKNREPRVWTEVNGATVLSPDDRMRIFGDVRGENASAWEYFYRQYPASKGLLRASQAGVSRDGRWAVIWTGLQTSEAAMATAIRVLRRTSDGWQMYGLIDSL